MLKNLLGLRSRHYLTVEVNSCKEKKASVLQLSRTDRDLRITRCLSATLVELNTLLASNQSQVLINFSRKDVLVKKIRQTPDLSKAVANAYPNINSEDFYIETLSTSNASYVSICRKQTVDEILSELNENNTAITGFRIGPLATTYLAPYITDGMLITENYKLHFANNELQSIEPHSESNSETYQINGLDLDSNSVLPFASALSHWEDNDNFSCNYQDELEVMNSEYRTKTAYQCLLKGSLVFLFVLLLANFLVFMNLQEEHQHASSEYGLQSNYANQLTHLENQVNKKEKLLQEISRNQSTQSSVYLDSLGASLPNSMILSSLDFQPPQKKTKKDKAILYTEQQILISGSLQSTLDFSNWIKELEGFPWVQEVTVLQLGINKKGEKEFEIQLQL